MSNKLPIFSKSKIALEAQKLIQVCNSRALSTDQLIQLTKKSPSFYVEQIDNEFKVFLDIISSEKPQVICEIGSYRGGSLFLFSRVSPPDAFIISVDLNFPGERKNVYQSFARQKQRILCVEGDSSLDKTLKKVKRSLKGKPIDLLFIDGDHSFFGVANDFVRYSPLVRRGGMIAFHDIVRDTFLKTGIKSSSYTGEVPIFWDGLKHVYTEYQEIISDSSQDGYGIGIIHKNW